MLASEDPVSLQVGWHELMIRLVYYIVLIGHPSKHNLQYEVSNAFQFLRYQEHWLCKDSTTSLDSTPSQRCEKTLLGLRGCKLFGGSCMFLQVLLVPQ